MIPLTQPPSSLPDFFATNNSTVRDATLCFESIYHCHPRCTISPIEKQGGCSYTLLIRTAEGAESIVQFRLHQHAISPRIARDAERIFMGLAPRVMWMDSVQTPQDDDGLPLQVIEMERVRGVGVADVLPLPRSELLGQEVARMESLLCDLADFFVMARDDAVGNGERRRRRTVARGLVASSMLDRLGMLARDLPTAPLRELASGARKAVAAGGLADLPIVLNHGDLLPRNLLIDAETWRLTGVVDWAESEYLPFGMTLYGIEHLLGYVERSSGAMRFVYYHEADSLREVFWARLRCRVPELVRPEIWHGMLLARIVGMLLWHGVAWDDGKRNRAVSFEHDEEDLVCLEAFLGGNMILSREKL